MKKITFLTLLILTAIHSFSQTQPSAKTKDYYLQKSKNQRTIGWVLLGAGTATAAIGVIIGSGKSSDLGDIGQGVAPLLIGVATDIASIPFFISAGHNKRKAAAITFNMQDIQLQDINGHYAKREPSAGLKISL